MREIFKILKEVNINASYGSIIKKGNHKHNTP